MNMPLMIDLSNKKVVIVGGGKVATRRAKTLLAYTKTYSCCKSNNYRYITKISRNEANHL